MIVIYSYGTIYKKDADTGVFQCPNCGHITPHGLYRRINRVSIFYIPVINIRGKSGETCEYCGFVRPLNISDYRKAKKAARL